MQSTYNHPTKCELWWQSIKYFQDFRNFGIEHVNMSPFYAIRCVPWNFALTITRQKNWFCKVTVTLNYWTPNSCHFRQSICAKFTKKNLCSYSWYIEYSRSWQTSDEWLEDQHHASGHHASLVQRNWGHLIVYVFVPQQTRQRMKMY